RARVLQRAGGVPFFLMSCAQALLLGELEDGGENAVPWDVAQGVRQRVAALPQRTREVLGMAAVVGRQVPRGLLITVAARCAEEVLKDLGGAAGRRRLAAGGGGGSPSP